ncbi:abortive infection family protein [Dehalococcoidales bacterium]|nr:abortive infection family protein [Dehalococcoidales bacterium]
MRNKQRFSPQYIDALAECITGGSAWDHKPAIGLYRSGPEIVRFFRSLGYDVTYGNWSRVPFTRDLLIDINLKEDGFEQLIRITERLLDPRDYVGREDKLENVVNHLNEYLKYDGFELTRIGTTYRLVEAGGTAPVTEIFGSTTLSLPNVKADFERALSSIESDPAGAITSACSTLESVAKSILDGLGKPYPKDQSIQPLVFATLRELALAPDQYSEAEIKRILGGLVNVLAGIGVLRTKYGDAHGRGTEFAQLLPRHARLAVNAASTIGLFLLETYLDIKS